MLFTADHCQTCVSEHRPELQERIHLLHICDYPGGITREIRSDTNSFFKIIRDKVIQGVQIIKNPSMPFSCKFFLAFTHFADFSWFAWSRRSCSTPYRKRGLFMEPRENQAVEFLDAGPATFMSLINELNDIRGYKASAILSHEGELLYSNTTDLVNIHDLSVSLGVFNSLFGHACGLSEKSGFVACDEVMLRAGEEIIVMRCSGKDCLVGIRLFVLIEEHGNIVIMQRRLGNLLPRLMRCLTWEPDNLVPLYMREAAGRLRKERIVQEN